MALVIVVNVAMSLSIAPRKCIQAERCRTNVPDIGIRTPRAGRGKSVLCTYNRIVGGTRNLSRRGDEEKKRCP